MIDTSSIDLLTLVEKDTQLKNLAATYGGEYAGSCPFCGGTDRFRVWPYANYPHFWCRQCGRSGDAIDYVQERDKCDFKAALERLGLDQLLPRQNGIRPFRQPTIPAVRGLVIGDLKPGYAALVDEDWQTAAQDFCRKAVDYLHSPKGLDAYNYLLNERRLTPDVIQSMQLGYNPTDEHTDWGTRKVWLPQGIVIPWWIENRIWRVNFRMQGNRNGQRYIQAAGSANGLYNVDRIKYHCTVVLVEGEIDALTIMAHLTHRFPEVIAVATVSTQEARVLRWLVALDLADTILLAFDNDGEPGDKASDYWKILLGSKALRLRPTRKDVNQMTQEGDDLVCWITKAICPF